MRKGLGRAFGTKCAEFFLSTGLLRAVACVWRGCGVNAVLNWDCSAGKMALCGWAGGGVILARIIAGAWALRGLNSRLRPAACAQIHQITPDHTISPRKA